MKESGLTLFRLAGVIPGMRILRVTYCAFLLNWGLGHVANAEDSMAKGRDLENRTLYGPAIAEYQQAIKETPEQTAEAH
jgi:hypothetical protein